MISKAKKKADLVIVQTHWGQEYDNDPNDRQRQLARAMSDAGADIIVGHHPHVLEPIEMYHGTVIFYSLGKTIMIAANGHPALMIFICFSLRFLF